MLRARLSLASSALLATLGSARWCNAVRRAGFVFVPDTHKRLGPYFNGIGRGNKT